MLSAWLRTDGTCAWSWRTRTRCSTRQVWWFRSQNHPALQIVGFAEFGPPNSVMAVPEGTGDSTWPDHGGCVKAKQLRVKDMAIGSKT
jgi:hypothetical protein